MTRFVFKKLPREQLAILAKKATEALADRNNFDTFTLTLNVEDTSGAEVVKGADDGNPEIRKQLLEGCRENSKEDM